MQADKGLASSQESLDLFKTMASAEQQMAEVHAGIHRTVGLVDSLDEDKIKSLRTDFGTQLAGVPVGGQ